MIRIRRRARASRIISSSRDARSSTRAKKNILDRIITGYYSPNSTTTLYRQAYYNRMICDEQQSDAACLMLWGIEVRNSQITITRNATFWGFVHVWVGMINSIFFSRSLNGRCYGNRFLAPIDETWQTLASFCALAFHNGWKDCNSDARVNTADDPFTSDKNLMNIGAEIPEFCWRNAAGRATRCSLPHI